MRVFTIGFIPAIDEILKILYFQATTHPHRIVIMIVDCKIKHKLDMISEN